ncbi:MAG: TIGR04283 family arsenosugar biosynthesis glycosyltransferase, partial [Betaproteobacteria bacterium]
LNEAAGVVAALERLQPLRAQGHEVIVVDGGSDDATVAVAGPLADRTLHTQRGRAVQMNAGSIVARGEALLFLHADSWLPGDAAGAIARALSSGAHWGRFDVNIAGEPAILKVVATMMNVRSRLTGIATGDQGIFVLRDTFNAIGGYPLIALMEDIALSTALKRRAGFPACLHQRIVTSGRRWERHGPWRTIVKMWRLRLAYAMGADPEHLARHYS